MKKNFSLILGKEFIQYCEVNKVDDIETLAKKVFERGFTIEKYGETPNGKSTVIEKIINKEIIVEKQLPPIIEYIEKEVIKEVPVEVIVEKIVEVIKEVPIKTKKDSKVIIKEVIKEVPVEKIVEVEVIKEINNTIELDKLTKENEELKIELEKIKSSLDKFNRATYMKNSNLGSLYDE